MSSLPPSPSSSSDDECPAEAGLVTEAEKELTRLNNKWSAVFALAIGLYDVDDDGVHSFLINVEKPPFSLLKKSRKSFKPSVSGLRDEVTRRYELYYASLKQPRPTSWTMVRCIEWLEKYPVPGPSDETKFIAYSKE
mgnify:CR=1 FL=1